MRKLAGMMVMVLLALLIAACGSDGGDETPTAEPTEELAATTAPVETATEIATEAATLDTAVGSGTPIVAATPGPMATPSVARIDASPVAIASPADEDPASGSAVIAPDVENSETATPAAGMVTLRGEVTLPGTLGETYVIAEDGCVGLNGYSDMKAGRQLVVRDETGTIIGVTEIEASDAQDTCSWSFSLGVPRSAFYAVSVPMEVEHVFSQDEMEQSDGEITVPLS